MKCSFLLNAIPLGNNFDTVIFYDKNYFANHILKYLRLELHRHFLSIIYAMIALKNIFF